MLYQMEEEASEKQAFTSDATAPKMMHNNILLTATTTLVYRDFPWRSFFHINIDIIHTFHLIPSIIYLHFLLLVTYLKILLYYTCHVLQPAQTCPDTCRSIHTRIYLLTNHKPTTTKPYHVNIVKFCEAIAFFLGLSYTFAPPPNSIQNT